MPARRSEAPALTDAEKRGEGAISHWDDAARRAARPASFERSLPNRDIDVEGEAQAARPACEDSSAASADGPDGDELSPRRKATDE